MGKWHLLFTSIYDTIFIEKMDKLVQMRLGEINNKMLVVAVTTAECKNEMADDETTRNTSLEESKTDAEAKLCQDIIIKASL